MSFSVKCSSFFLSSFLECHSLWRFHFSYNILINQCQEINKLLSVTAIVFHTYFWIYKSSEKFTPFSSQAEHLSGQKYQQYPWNEQGIINCSQRKWISQT